MSTTDTIGSFRTAFSGSLSTLYFSAKSNCEDGVSTTDTLNWTMNGSTYDNFDELSDTSTLVGCEDLAASLDEVQNNRYNVQHKSIRLRCGNMVLDGAYWYHR